MALVPPLDGSPEDVKRALAPLRHDASIAVVAAGNAFAVGAIVRIAHNFLAREVVLIGTDPHYEKASMGMEKYETIVTVPDEASFLSHLGTRPLWALEKEVARRPITAVDVFPPDVVFLFGSERFGVPASLLERADEVLAIETYGVNHSLPLAIAAGITMHEWARRKYAASLVR
jgi:tRNA G18 (ribose-2'-O)-methylase SpoU